MIVRLSAQSRLDLEEIGDFIALDNPLRAVTFVRELRRACARIGRMPTAYRLRPEIGDGLRSAAHKRYVLFFTVSDVEVLIVRVLHGARDIGPEEFDLPSTAGES